MSAKNAKAKPESAQRMSVKNAKTGGKVREGEAAKNGRADLRLWNGMTGQAAVVIFRDAG
jgi:hypothetical protein